MGTGAAEAYRASRDCLLSTRADHVREHLNPYQRVRRIEFYELPKTISGKIHRVELREREEDVCPVQTTTEWRDDQLQD